MHVQVALPQEAQPWGRALLDSDITDDITCAKLINSRQGFDAWNGWKSHCPGVTLPSTSDCSP
ncbi:Lysozyme c-1 [Gryllus bimaculatus]|nr:Lysozyme c-1 [Gryllus bimaculatus]